MSVERMDGKMLDGVEKIFENMQTMMKKLKKASYEKNMVGFRDEHGHYFSEMMAYMEAAEDKESAAKEIASEFVDRVEGNYKVKGRINGRIQADLNFFMIYYTFPALLMTGSDHAKTVADAVCAECGSRFKDSRINYADYDTIYAGFREKILGIF